MTLQTGRGIESHRWHPNRLLFGASKPFSLPPESSAAVVLGAQRVEFRSPRSAAQAFQRRLQGMTTRGGGPCPRC